MKDGAILANAGHFDVELDLTGLREMAKERREIRDHLEEYELAVNLAGEDLVRVDLELRPMHPLPLGAVRIGHCRPPALALA